MSQSPMAFLKQPKITAGVLGLASVLGFASSQPQAHSAPPRPASEAQSFFTQYYQTQGASAATVFTLGNLEASWKQALLAEKQSEAASQASKLQAQVSAKRALAAKQLAAHREAQAKAAQEAALRHHNDLLRKEKAQAALEAQAQARLASQRAAARKAAALRAQADAQAKAQAAQIAKAKALAATQARAHAMASQKAAQKTPVNNSLPKPQAPSKTSVVNAPLAVQAPVKTASSGSSFSSHDAGWACTVKSGDSHLQAWPAVVRTRIREEFGISDIGGYRPEEGSDHATGEALDVMVYGDKAKGDAIASWVLAHQKELNLKYVIWQQHIWAPYRQYWRPMEDRGSATANHMDHVHISFLPGSGTCPTS